MEKLINLSSDCPMDLTINILSGKWKITNLWHIEGIKEEGK
jgi:DNA-binding HxlR family transcriptional regulator